MESAVSAQQPKSPGIRFRPSLFVTFFILALAVAVLLALGAWQLLRQRQADAAESVREARIATAPLAWRSDPPLTPEEVDFHRIQITGRWDNAHTMILSNAARYDIRGEEVVTPLLPDDGGPAVLVDRGWYPIPDRDHVLAALAAEDHVTVEGLGRTALKPEGASLIVTGTTSGRTPGGAWAWFDIPTMAQGLPYPVVPWRLTQGVRDPGDPSPPSSGQLPVQFWGTDVTTEPHMEYALTWFSLAAALVIAGLRIRAERRGSA